VSEEACIIKTFKFFDVMDKGSVNFQEFCRVLEKINMYYPPEQLKPLFDYYDSDGSGAVDYKELTAVVFGNEVSNKALVKKNERVEPRT
jgi:Ca2+-binding EF-hand superfamily protein